MSLMLPAEIRRISLAPGPRKWDYLGLDDRSVFAIGQSPHEPDVLLAGTQPPSLHRSDDGGTTWRQIPIDVPQTCELIGIPRVTQILFDPRDRGLIWVTVEIGGVFRSRHAGATWEKASAGLVSEDMHGIAVCYRDGARRLLATTNKGLHVSHDDGESWVNAQLPADLNSTLWGIATLPDAPGLVYVCSALGQVYRSEEAGGSWTRLGRGFADTAR